MASSEITCLKKDTLWRVRLQIRNCELENSSAIQQAKRSKENCDDIAHKACAKRKNILWEAYFGTVEAVL